MNTVWVVEKGLYSDYRVVGVFSSKENAQRVADYVGGDVAEWPLDPWTDELNQGRSAYYVSMYRDGDILTIYRDKDLYRDDSDRPILIYSATTKKTYIAGHVFATDELHAIKIVNEIRAQRIADGSWPE